MMNFIKISNLFLTKPTQRSKNKKFSVILYDWSFGWLLLRSIVYIVTLDTVQLSCRLLILAKLKTWMQHASCLHFIFLNNLGFVML